MKLSLKKLKEQMYFLNLITEQKDNKQFHIVAFGRDMNTGEVISIERHTDFYSQKISANWRYHLVWGTNTKRK
jgi:hypothetical protein